VQRLRGTALAVGAALLLAGCSAAAQASGPTWKPQISYEAAKPGPTIEPVLPPHPSRSTKPPPSQPSTGPAPVPSPSATKATDAAVVAKHLAAPTGLVLMPDGTALVGERTTGRIVRVQPQPNQPVTKVRTLSGLSTAGGGGLLDLALSPHYVQDSLLFAYVTTATDNRVVAFTLTGPVTAVLTGIPKGTSDNAGRIAFGPDGYLYVGTGDAGHPALAADPHSLAGKVLRVSDIGKPASGNPSASSAVYASGFRGVAGLCVEPATASMLEVDPGQSADGISVVAGGATYGWPTASTTDRTPIAALPAADRGPGGCAMQNGNLFVTSLDGDALLESPVSTKGTAVTLGKFTPLLVKKYGRLLTVVAAPDGALWLTTANKDGHGRPVPDDERVLRITLSGGGANQPPV
jgi:glucose/arabinose dehydrogenase